MLRREGPSAVLIWALDSFAEWLTIVGITPVSVAIVIWVIGWPLCDDLASAVTGGEAFALDERPRAFVVRAGDNIAERHIIAGITTVSIDVVIWVVGWHTVGLTGWLLFRVISGGIRRRDWRVIYLVAPTVSIRAGRALLRRPRPFAALI